MDAKEVGIVTTTIHRPTFLGGYVENARENGYPLDGLSIIVVGDLKTPPDAEEYCRSLTSEFGIEVTYMSVDDQIEWLDERGLDALRDQLPYNSVQRRNVGYLAAYERGVDVILSLDDDNLAGEGDVFREFSRVGETQEVLEVTSSNDWYNCASILNYEDEASRDVYHRGFPYSKRGEDVTYEFEEATREVGIHAGLWLDVPDVDVITHLERGPRSVSLREEYDRPVALGPDTFCPVNTQNTAFDADLIPLVYAIPMGDEIEGMELRRYCDIWLGFFAERVLHETGATVAYGRPLSYHDRNVHDLYRELEHEAVGIRLNEVVVDVLESIAVEGSGPLACYRDLVREFRAELDAREVAPEFEGLLGRTLDGMDVWANACETIG